MKNRIFKLINNYYKTLNVIQRRVIDPFLVLPPIEFKKGDSGDRVGIFLAPKRRSRCTPSYPI